MPEQKPAWAIKAGDFVVDPSTGVWAEVHEVQAVSGEDPHYWFLWGQVRPQGSIGARFRADAEVTMRPPTEETWDDLLE